MAQHRTPWTVTAHQHYPKLGWIKDRDGEAVGQMMDLETADRIVACVNACEGIPAARLHDGALSTLIEAVREFRRVAVWDDDTTDRDEFEAAAAPLDAALRAVGEG